MAESEAPCTANFIPQESRLNDVAEQIDLFIQNPESELLVQSQDVALQIDAPQVELVTQAITQELSLENPVYELAIAQPDTDYSVYEPWNKQGILQRFNATKTELLTPYPILYPHEEINEETLNRHAHITEQKINKALSFLEYLVSEITR